MLDELQELRGLLLRAVHVHLAGHLRHHLGDDELAVAVRGDIEGRGDAKSKLEKSKQVVRPPRKSAVAGVILTFAGVAVLIKNLAGTPDTLFLIGSIVAIIFGVILLCTYFSVVIYFDDEGFLYKAWGHGRKEFRYSQIRGQRSLLTRGGVNTILFVGDEEINLYSAMQNLNAFLSKAFFKWCAVKGIDPDTIENNPRMATYFPDPDNEPAQG